MKNDSVLEHLQKALVEIEKRLQSSALSMEQKQLEFSKSQAITVIYKYIEQIATSNEKSEALFQLWKDNRKNSKDIATQLGYPTQDALRAALNRLKNKIEEKVGKDTIALVMQSNSIEEIMEVLGRIQ